MKEPVKFSAEVRERASRTVNDAPNDHPSQLAAVESIAAQIGYTPQTLPCIEGKVVAVRK